jgi:hypothetical protein
MRVSELSVGYGKFEYKREGLTGQMASSYRCFDRECTPHVEFSLPRVRLGTQQKTAAYTQATHSDSESERAMDVGFYASGRS